MRRALVPLAVVALVGGLPAVAALDAGATVNTCQARNLTQGTARDPDLQAVIDAATAGDTVQVKRVCVGTFTIARDLTLVGEPTRRVRKATLDGNGSGRVLLLEDPEIEVTLTNVKITGGTVDGSDAFGGGIYSFGMLTLNGSRVAGNTAGSGGGIFNRGTLILNGGSAVIRNTATYGGGISNDISDGSAGDVTLNDSSSVSGNTAVEGGGIHNIGALTLNGSSSVSGNRALYDGGGIKNEGSLEMNGASSVSHNGAADRGSGGGIYNLGSLTLNDSASVSGNVAAPYYGGGIWNYGIVTLHDRSSVLGNAAGSSGGGIFNHLEGVLAIDGLSSVSGNVADADSDGTGVGGGIFDCGVVTGALAGVNVLDNRLGGGEVNDIDHEGPYCT